jgi:hypothetical protein
MRSDPEFQPKYALTPNFGLVLGKLALLFRIGCDDGFLLLIEEAIV